MPEWGLLGLWWYLTNLWTLVMFAAITWDFHLDNGFGKFVCPIAAVYIAILAIYAGDKEFERWHHIHESRHPGELFVVAWTLLILTILVLDFILAKSYSIPAEVISTYIAVLSIMAITRRSKLLYKRSR